MDSLPNATRRPAKPAGHYGTIKLVGVTAEELMEKYGLEEAASPQGPQRARGTVEDIAGLMQTSQRAQNKGKQTFWEKISTKKKKTEEKKPKTKPKDSKRDKENLQTPEEPRRRPKEESPSHRPIKTLESTAGSSSKVKTSDLKPKRDETPSREKPEGSKTEGKENKDALKDRTDSKYTDETRTSSKDLKPEIKIEPTKPGDKNPEQAKPAGLWKTLTRQNKKKIVDDDEKATTLARYLTQQQPTKPKPTRENSQSSGGSSARKSEKPEKAVTPTTSEKDESEIAVESLNIIASNLNDLEKDLKSSSGSSSSTSETAEALTTNESISTESSVEDKFANFEVHPGQEVIIFEKLGKGATAVVWRAQVEGRDVALKQISLKSMKLGTKSGELICKHEYDLVRGLSHPNIIKYCGIIFNQKEQEVNLFMELIHGCNLTDLVLYQTKLKPAIASYILELILKAVSYLHSKFIIHRDLKPDNVLLTLGGSLKLVDFGTFSKDASDVGARPRSTVGTPWYCAPEIIIGEDYSNAADIWSLGCMTIEMLDGKPPFEDLNDVACLFKMAEGKPPPFPTNISSDCTQFFTKTLEPNWKNRPTAVQLLQYNFITSFLPQKAKTALDLRQILTEMHAVKESHVQKQFERLTQRIATIKK